MIEGDKLPVANAVRRKVDYPVLRAPRNYMRVLRLLSEVVGQCFHWREGKSHPCRAGCPYCPDRLLRWKGYVCAMLYLPDRRAWKPVTLELGERAARVLEDREARGLLVRIRRGGGVHDSLELEVMSQTSAEPAGWQKLPTWDVLAVVFRLCGLPSEQMEQPAECEGAVILAHPKARPA